MSQINKVLSIMVLSFMLSGCAISYVDSDGANHTIGLAHVVHKTETEGEAIANIHQVQAIGFYFIGMEQQSSIGLGYTNAFQVSVEEDNAIELLIDRDSPLNLEIETTSSLLRQGDVQDEE